MNAPSAPSQDIFDVRKIRRLVELMKEHDLSEIDLQQGEVRIQLHRACGAQQTAMVRRPGRGGAPSDSAGPDRPRPSPTSRSLGRQGERHPGDQESDGGHVLCGARS